MVRIRKFFKDLYTNFQDNAKNYGHFFILLGFFVLIAAIILIFFNSPYVGELVAVFLGLFSVGLGCIAIDMSLKSDKKYTEILKRVDKNIVDIVSLVTSIDKEHDIIEHPSGNIILKPEPASLALKTYPPEQKIKKGSKEYAQKRLDDDTRKVGFVRGEIFQTEDGSWAISWGGKYPL